MKILNVIVSIMILSSLANARSLRTKDLEPVPADVTTIEAQLKRFKGQTQFLNSPGSVMRFRDQNGQQQQQQQEGGDERDVQEADVFKVGKPGSKLLFLLNNYRGLQVVDFSKGAAHPELIGRAEATGNMPDKMYYDSANDQIIVLENIEDFDDEFRPYSQQQSRVLVYDVSQPRAPRLAQILSVDGEVADSRMVGNILYLANSISPDWNDVRPYEKSSKGLVYSLTLSKNEVKVKERIELALPASARENMNIVSTTENGKMKYYLLAVLSESRWGWWDRQSLVEVVDITDANGHIESKMVVSAKGQIQERSQTTIKNETLIVVSNYRNEGSVSRIAVETFKLPTKTSETLTEDEVLRRKLNIDHSLVGLTGQLLEQRRAVAIADANEGILGRFVKTPQGLRKIIADSFNSVGDDTGLHASLRDVRFVGDLLYAFWVPANNIDPLDIFDISKPEVGVNYVKRLKFDGWIDRSFPVRYNNRDYIVGLGYVVPTFNNETNSRKPQVILFEVVKNGNDIEAIERTKVMIKKDAFANFNDSDKDVEIKMGPNGTGTILFEVSFRDGRHWVEGGKLVHFDLTKSEIKEGGFLKGDAQWLRRVFNNSEIDLINTFTDESLATFDANEQLGEGNVGRAVSILELARDILGYAVLNSDSKSYGVQIINKENDESTDTLLRLVNPKNADAERADTLSEITLKGDYETHFTGADGSLWVATEEQADQTRITKVHQVIRKGTKLQAKAAITLNGYEQTWRSESKFQKLEDETILYSNGASAFRIVGNQAQEIKLQGCETNERKVDEIQVLDGKLYAALVESVNHPTQNDVRYERNFVAPLVSIAGGLNCGDAINIPGRAISFTANRIITEDRRLVDTTDSATGYYLQEDNALESLTFAGNQAKLVDDYVMNVESDDDYFPQDYVRFSSEHFGYFEFASDNSRRDVSKFISVAIATDGSFTKEQFVMPKTLLNNAYLLKVMADPSEKGAFIGLLTNFNKAQVVRWSSLSARPVIQMVSTLGADQKLTTPAAEVNSPFLIYTFDEEPTTLQMSYSKEQKSLQFPMSYFGVMQLFLN